MHNFYGTLSDTEGAGAPDIHLGCQNVLGTRSPTRLPFPCVACLSTFCVFLVHSLKWVAPKGIGAGKSKASH